MTPHQDIPDSPAESAPRRLAIGGVSAVIAVALAFNAVFGAMTAGVVHADRFAEGIVARTFAVAIVRGFERARVRDQDVPAASLGRPTIRLAMPGDVVVALTVAADRADRHLLCLWSIDLPPPAVA